jgi:superfamily II DNA or RNA helicase
MVMDQKWDPVKKRMRTSFIPGHTFGLKIQSNAEFRFHIGQFSQFVGLMKQVGVHESTYTIIKEEFDTSACSIPDLKLRDNWIAREDQLKPIEFALSEDSGKDPLLALPTGFGKTFIALSVAGQRQMRLGLFILAEFIDKWIMDIHEKLNIELDEIAVIQGASKLQAATDLSRWEKRPKAYIFSITTLQKWYDAYRDGDYDLLSRYECLPYELCQHLGIGTCIFDEIHKHPYSIYRTKCHLHVPKIINLSATLFTKDHMLRKVNLMMYPPRYRFDEITMEKYIKVYACAYRMDDIKYSKIRTSYTGNTYNHIAFEESILKLKYIRDQYVKMILDLLETGYIKRRQPGDRSILFVASKKFATYLSLVIKKQYPHLTCETYLQEDAYVNMLVPDIRVTTIISGSTAHDVPNLITAIMTNAIDSPNSNIQALGRLRNLKDKEMRFYYTYSFSLEKHVQYHQARKMLYSTRAKAYYDEILPPIQCKPPIT